MKKIFFTLLLALPFAAMAQNAKIKIDVDRKIADIDPKIYGVFMEQISRAAPSPDGGATHNRTNSLYGPIYNPSSPLANADGFKTDYIDAWHELKLTNMRWPGGNYVADYDWRNGIGPKNLRPVTKELAWGGIDSNQVGTDEWVKYNKSLGSENVLCVNLGTGSIDEAAHLVEYCNSPAGTLYANMRVKYGNPEPFKIKYWGLGNEEDGEPWELAAKSAEDYCKLAREAAKIMRSVDKDIKFTVCGSSRYGTDGQWIDWNQQIITELRDVADYISIHRYWDRSDDYYTFIGQRALDVDEKISITAAQIAQVRTRYNIKRPIYLAVDEWGSFGRGFLPVLATAQYYNSFIRHADVVKMSNFTLLTAILAQDPAKGSYKTPLFYMLKLYANNCLGDALDVFVDCGTFKAGDEDKPIPYLDVTSVYSKETNSIIINVVNRHKDQAITADISDVTGSFAGKATVSELNAVDTNAPFTFEKQSQYGPVSKELNVKGGKLTYSFPAHSFTQIIVKQSM